KRKYSVLGFCLKKIAKSMTPTSRFFMTTMTAMTTMTEKPPSPGWANPSQARTSLRLVLTCSRFFRIDLIKY
ncbi:hypothetical protein M2E54_27425, partial [Klebsiella pneumoniae]|nr:hypothetical protein [Klebsiella pneumoniae]